MEKGLESSKETTKKKKKVAVQIGRKTIAAEGEEEGKQKQEKKMAVKKPSKF